ncbi:cytochrome c1 [uncultured Pelagimonas sp.]|uniref:cytochrome c1 n=1 Tax=uncultured Pelagimonas sp. TaxID=1618102 RepID=UPI00261AACE4|nr:cytochrome c1 [uncultured Pelagimonas sp.]
MFKKLTLSALTALAIGTTGAMAAGTGGHIENIDFSFDGAFGVYDQAQLQRGLQVYTEVCASCHGLQYVPFRTLGDPGGPTFSEDEVRAYAEQNFEIYDEELEDFRPAKPADHFPANTSAGAPDLTLMAKARAGFHGPYGLGINQFFKGIGGPEYIVALLNGYADAPDCTPDDMEGAYNTVFASGGYPDACKDEDGHHLYPGSWIAMGQPLYGEDVEYADGHPTTLHHEAEDVAAFLMWAAEPKMMARKQAGFTAVLFLSVLAVLLYLTNKRLWKPIKYGRKDD